MINLINKILSFSKDLNNNNYFYKLKNDKKTSLVFYAIESYSETSEIRYVGGCIRKILKEEKVDDIDFAVNLKPSQCIDALKKNNINSYETGIDHGTITAQIENNKYEITSLRKDTKTDGRHAKVEFSKNWYEDASRRDFTINSIYSDIEGNLYDPFNGKKDLELGKVKFIGNPNNRIKEDYLRILRYLRFFIDYSNFEHTEEVIKAIRQNINGISSVSKERLLDEFFKITKSKNFLKLFKDTFCKEIIALIFPEFKNLNIFSNLNSFAIENISKVDYIFLICLMILDDTDNAEYFLYKFNISNINKKRILLLKNFYQKNISKDILSEKNLRKLLYINGKEFINDLLYFEIFKSKKINKKIIKLINYFQDKNSPVLPIKGKDIIKKYNLKEGEIVGIKLREIEEKWISNDFKISNEEISKIFSN
tara:strand:+ start:44 stop:1315 length:1272 start_codon:yes stop_codon:yes gene_type:complete